MEPVCNAVESGPDDTFDINAVVIVKTFVFDRNESMGKIFGDHVHGNRNTVGIGSYQLCGLVAFYVVHESRKAGGRHI